MPAVIELRLALDHRPTVYPARLHGAACALLEPPTLSHDSGHKPFVVWPLLDDGAAAVWRLGWLSSAPPASPPRRVVFGPTCHDVLGSRVEEVSFADLAACAPVRRAELDCVSPLYFSRNGRDHPLPDPTLIVRSAMTRWSQHAPAAFAIPDTGRAELLDTVYLVEMDGSTVRGAVGATTYQTGFVGTVTLGLTHAASDATAALFAAMLRFIDIAGAGAQTTHGFGAIRVSLPNRTDHSRNRLRGPGPRSASAHVRSSGSDPDRATVITQGPQDAGPRHDPHPAWPEPSPDR